MFHLFLGHIPLGVPMVESKSRDGKVDFRVRHRFLLGDSVRHKDQIFSHKTVKYAVVDATDSRSKLIHSVTQQVRMRPAKLMPKLPKQLKHVQTFLKRLSLSFFELGEPFQNRDCPILVPEKMDRRLGHCGHLYNVMIGWFLAASQMTDVKKSASAALVLTETEISLYPPA